MNIDLDFLLRKGKVKIHEFSGLKRSVVEYPFPFEEDYFRPDHRLAITPWLRKLQGLSGLEILDALLKSWEELSDPAWSIANFLANGYPRGIIADSENFDGKIWVAFEDPKLGRPFTLIREKAVLTQDELDNISRFDKGGLKDICEAFPAVIADIAPWGHFFGVDPTPLDEDELYNLGDWKESLAVCTPPDGSRYLLRRNGIVGRWDHSLAFEEGVIVHFNSFEDFVNAYIDSRKSLPGFLG